MESHDSASPESRFRIADSVPLTKTQPKTSGNATHHQLACDMTLTLLAALCLFRFEEGLGGAIVVLQEYH